MRLPLKVAGEIRAYKLFAPGERLLAALSGGPDSVALLLCLRELSKKRDLRFHLTAAHLNHRLRGRDADADQEFCRRLCRREKVEFLTAACEVRAAARRLRLSVEEAGRVVRHAFLKEAARAAGCTAVVLGHHADDRIETVLYRLCRGTGVAGLRGMSRQGPPPPTEGAEFVPPAEWAEVARRTAAKRAADGRSGGKGGGGKSGAKESGASGASGGSGGSECRLVRPLLNCSRAEIITYLRQKRRRWRTDAENADTDIPRNALRHEVLPLLERKVHPGVRAALRRLAEEAETAATGRERRRRWTLAWAQLEKRGELLLPVNRAEPSPDTEELADAAAVLAEFWKLPRREITAKHLAAVRRLFGPAGEKKVVRLPNGLTVERHLKEVRFRRER